MSGLKQKLQNGTAKLRRLVEGLRARVRSWRPRHSKGTAQA
jgi:hypothetical protein